MGTPKTSIFNNPKEIQSQFWILKTETGGMGTTRNFVVMCDKLNLGILMCGFHGPFLFSFF